MTQPLRDTKDRPQTLRASFAAVACGAALLAACGGDVVNLGEGAESRQPPPPYSRCIDSPTLSVTEGPVPGSVLVDNQTQLDELEGCETIAGSLLVRPRFQPDLRPLHALKLVEGTLSFDDLWFEFDASDGDLSSSSEVPEEGWLPSLEGLEALERVGNLTLSSVAATDLSPLSRLQALMAGGLVLRGINVRDLAALAGLRGIRSLEISGEQLESIAALQLPSTLRQLDLRGPLLSNADTLRSVSEVEGDVLLANTALSDLGPLSGLRSIGGALQIIYNPSLRNLGGLESLRGVQGELIISGNPALENLDSLRGLGSAASLTVESNDALTRMPDLFMSRLRSLTISSNAALREVSGFPGLLDVFSPVRANSLTRALTTPEQLLEARADLIRVEDNPVLEHFAIPAGWQSIQHAVIQRNDSLLDLDIGTLEAIDLFTLEDNRALVSVDLGELVSVDVLSVVDNPQLAPAAFDSVQTFERQMSGNAGQ